MAYTVERNAKLIERTLASILLNEVNNEKLRFVSITKVVLNKDMSVATVWYTVFGNEGEIEATKKELEKANGFIRTLLAHQIQMRKVPELRFKYDESLAYGNHITEVLNNLK